MSNEANCRVIELRPYRNGWQCFEGPGVGPYWLGKDAKEQALRYAKERAKSDGLEIRVLNDVDEGLRKRWDSKFTWHKGDIRITRRAK
jgi:hypothetical protein